MKPCGVILTFIKWSEWKELPFNIALFVWQMLFMIVGTAYGKIKWAWRWRWPNWIDIIILTGFPIVEWITPEWCSIPIRIIAVFVMVAIIRGIPWRRVWRAAQCSHVRLVLEEPNSNHILHSRTANFGYPKMEIQYWRLDQCRGRFEYRNPTFDPSLEFIAAMIEYAEKQVGKRYDTLQLFSFGLNFIFWLWPPWWGKEKLKWLNLRGGKEVCTSGVTACLRWADRDFWDEYTREVGKTFGVKSLKDNRRFFPGYDTAVVPPCLVELSEEWRRE